MQCPQCQAENPERARFCEDCGARLEFKCPHCGEAATPGQRFCASCGGSLADAPAVSRPAPSPQDYTPQHLGLGTLYQKIGHDQQAQAELRAATEMYRSMEMTFWLTKAEAARARVAG